MPLKNKGGVGGWFLKQAWRLLEGCRISAGARGH